MVKAASLQGADGGSIPSTPTNPLQYDSRINRGSVCITERGQLYITLGKFRRRDKTANGWHGIGFNGQRVSAEYPEFVASSVNAYILQYHKEE